MSIKPCPFCGAKIGRKDIYCTDDGWGCHTKGNVTYSIECPECTAEGPWATGPEGEFEDMKEEAIVLWNRRKNEPK
jgi:endogenous inhibitor of DNA gyrase (YacG/DUF329 family)